MCAKFEHDCNRCDFIAHMQGMDIHICPGGALGPTLIARHSSDGSDYSSIELAIFQRLIRDNGTIGSSVAGDMSFRDYLMSDKCSPQHKAWLIALQMWTPA